MGIWQTDVNIRTMLQLGFDDIRKNDWLVDDILGNFTSNPYLMDKHGQKQVDSCKEWLRNNEVPIVMNLRNDQDKFPMITINLGTSNEIEAMKTMADRSTESVQLMPSVIGRPIPYVVKPFSGFSYDNSSGEITIPSTVDTSTVSPGMIFVDPSTGNGYIVQGITPNGLMLLPGLNISASILGIVPQYQIYNARIEHSFFRETYSIGIHAHGDPQVLLWLHSIILYTILRYREGLLEANGFTEVNVSSGDMMANSNFSGPGGEVGFTRVITLAGMVEQTWIKQPVRTIETVVLRNTDPSGTIYSGGIKILSNTDSTLGHDTNWTAIEDGGPNDN